MLFSNMYVYYCDHNNNNYKNCTKIITNSLAYILNFSVKKLF